ncbi:hypothetical protein [Streptomyces fradiae]|uniref:recombination directionality factor n=1 Tax=Streptomyces fradiae TaxID=1906 RepID=UPI0039881893
MGDIDFGRAVGSKLLSQPVWCLLTPSKRVAQNVSRVLDAPIRSALVHETEQFEVVSKEPGILITVEGPESMTTQMKLWDSRGLVHHCDGRAFLSPASRAGHSCGCPPDMAERKERARLGQGPQPITTLLFRLADSPCADLFRFRSSSWRYAEAVEEVRAQLTSVRGPALCELAVQTVPFTTRNGRLVCYHKPVTRVLGADAGCASRS